MDLPDAPTQNLQLHSYPHGFWHELDLEHINDPIADFARQRYKVGGDGVAAVR